VEQSAKILVISISLCGTISRESWAAPARAGAQPEVCCRDPSWGHPSAFRFPPRGFRDRTISMNRRIFVQEQGGWSAPAAVLRGPCRLLGLATASACARGHPSPFFYSLNSRRRGPEIRISLTRQTPQDRTYASVA